MSVRQEGRKKEGPSLMIRLNGVLALVVCLLASPALAQQVRVGGELSERRAECAPATPTTTAGERCTRRQVETGARRRLSAIPGSRGQPHRACINPKRRR